jgi:predicted nucleic acid-binding protein
LNAASIDTNILVYAAELRRTDADGPKIVAAKALIEGLVQSGGIRIAAQALAELRHVLIRRSGLPVEAVNVRLAKYMDLEECIPTSHGVLQSAFALSAAHNLQTYDAVILAAAADAGCEILYSEDMQHGFAWRGVRVVNPFAGL